MSSKSWEIMPVCPWRRGKSGRYRPSLRRSAAAPHRHRILPVFLLDEGAFLLLFLRLFVVLVLDELVLGPNLFLEHLARLEQEHRELKLKDEQEEEPE